MAAIKLHVLKPSVNNLTVRIFTRAAGLASGVSQTRISTVPNSGLGRTSQ